MSRLDEIRKTTEYNIAAVHAAQLKTAYARGGSEALKRWLQAIGPEAAVKAEAILKANGDL